MILDVVGYHKYLAIKHFIAKELYAADKASGDVVVFDNDSFRSKIVGICKRCENRLIVQAPRRAMKAYIAIRATSYVTKVRKIVDEHFEPTDAYIPGLLSIWLLYEYQLLGYKDFSDIDFVALSHEYEVFNKEDKEHKALITKHIRCAIDVAEQLTKYKFKGK